MINSNEYRNLIHCVLQLRETIGHVAVIEEHGPKHGAIEIATTTASDMDKSGREEISKGKKELTEYKLQKLVLYLLLLFFFLQHEDTPHCDPIKIFYINYF